uniref:Uncharacterized protein n=1 Tax=Arundo donax TaxID=35708 RepID=A0A0A9GQ91_ARUDO
MLSTMNAKEGKSYESWIFGTHKWIYLSHE